MKILGNYDGINICQTKTHEYILVGQSQASAYAKGLIELNNSYQEFSVSGISTLEDAVTKLCYGGYIIDKRHLSWEVACNCISGPIDNVRLPALTVDIWREQTTFSSYNEFEMWSKDKNLSLTYLSVDLYAEYWKRLGAKVSRNILRT